MHANILNILRTTYPQFHLALPTRHCLSRRVSKNKAKLALQNKKKCCHQFNTMKQLAVQNETMLSAYVTMSIGQQT